jgi:hypothetical protein
MDEQERGRYYREIAAAFLSRRGAPFFLSPKDLELVRAWEQAEIPLEIVLEGIAAAFEAIRPGGRPRGKVLALAYCEASVARAWERRRDRRVGTARKAQAKRDPRAAVREAVRAFLGAASSEAGPPASHASSGSLEPVRAVFAAAAAGLDAEILSAEDLEGLDEKVEALLREAAPAAEVAIARADVRADHPRLPKGELERAAAVLLVKRLRAEHRIPYLAPFHHG